jgi:hypothetical protein
LIYMREAGKLNIIMRTNSNKYPQRTTKVYEPTNYELLRISYNLLIRRFVKNLHFRLVVLILVLHTSFLSSQTFDLSARTTDTTKVYKILPYKKFAVGIKAGLNVSQVFGAGTQGINHFGFAGGIRFSYRFRENFSFDPEVLYDMKGAARYANVEKGDYESFFVDLDYLEVPIIFNYHFGKRKNFSFEFGPSIGFLVREKITYNGGVVNSSNNSFHIYDISLLVGLNYNLPKGFGLNFRYMNSIVPIQNIGPNPNINVPTGIGSFNTVLNFSVNYMFGFWKPTVLANGTIEGKVIKEKKKKVKKQKGDIIDEDE